MKFELNQTIHYMNANRPHSAPVLARMKVDNLHTWSTTPEQQSLYTPFGIAGVFYRTCYRTVSEKEAYASKQEMLDALMTE